MGNIAPKPPSGEEEVDWLLLHPLTYYAADSNTAESQNKSSDLLDSLYKAATALGDVNNALGDALKGPPPAPKKFVFDPNKDYSNKVFVLRDREDKESDIKDNNSTSSSSTSASSKQGSKNLGAKTSGSVQQQSTSGSQCGSLVHSASFNPHDNKSLRWSSDWRRSQQQKSKDDDWLLVDDCDTQRKTESNTMGQFSDWIQSFVNCPDCKEGETYFGYAGSPRDVKRTGKGPFSGGKSGPTNATNGNTNSINGPLSRNRSGAVLVPQHGVVAVSEEDVLKKGTTNTFAPLYRMGLKPTPPNFNLPNNPTNRSILLLLDPDLKSSESNIFDTLLENVAQQISVGNRPEAGDKAGNASTATGTSTDTCGFGSPNCSVCQGRSLVVLIQKYPRALFFGLNKRNQTLSVEWRDLRNGALEDLPSDDILKQPNLFLGKCQEKLEEQRNFLVESEEKTRTDDAEAEKERLLKEAKRQEKLRSGAANDGKKITETGADTNANNKTPDGKPLPLLSEIAMTKTGKVMKIIGAEKIPCARIFYNTEDLMGGFSLYSPRFQITHIWCAVEWKCWGTIPHLKEIHFYNGKEKVYKYEHKE